MLQKQSDPLRPMDEVVAGLMTKSDKIRALAREGYPRADIARYLDIRYQHVRNVLVQDEQSGRALHPVSVSPATRPVPSAASMAPLFSGRESWPPMRLLIDADGSLRVPSSLVAALGLKPGEAVVAAQDGDVMTLMGIPAAVRRVQEIVRRFVPENVSLVDELIAERRAEAAREALDD